MELIELLQQFRALLDYCWLWFELTSLSEEKSRYFAIFSLQHANVSLTL